MAVEISHKLFDPRIPAEDRIFGEIKYKCRELLEQHSISERRIIKRDYNTQQQRYQDFLKGIGIKAQYNPAPSGDNFIAFYNTHQIKIRGIGNSFYTIEEIISRFKESLESCNLELGDIGIIHLKEDGSFALVGENNDTTFFQQKTTGSIEVDNSSPTGGDLERCFETISEDEILAKYHKIRNILLNSQITFTGRESKNKLGYYFTFKAKDYYIEGLDSCPVDMIGFASTLRFLLRQKQIDILEITSLKFHFTNMWECEVSSEKYTLPFSFPVPIHKRDVLERENSPELEK